MILDAHTHRLRRNAVVDIDPVDLRRNAGHRLLDSHLISHPVFRQGYLYSVGIHPWNVFELTCADLRMLRALAAEPQVVAIGECGLDAAMHSAGISRSQLLSRQTELLRFHIALSEELRKPLILHVVKAYSELIALKKELRPIQRWIVHGFRGRPELAKQLLSHGFTLSFGRRYNTESFALTPPDRRLRETDSPA